MPTSLDKVEITGLLCDNWVCDWVYSNSGIIVKDKTFDEVENNLPNCILIYEKAIWQNSDRVLQLIKNDKVETIAVYVGHIFLFPDKVAQELNEIAKRKNIIFLSMSQKLIGYKNIKCYSFDTIEHAISNDFNFLLSCELAEHRNPTKDFIFFVHLKQDDRKTIWNYLKDTKIFDNSIVFANNKQQMINVGKPQDEFYAEIKKVTINDNISSAIKGWGGYAPNFKAYEEVFCEIVIESRNDGLVGDLSEKTYRPIALNVPFVFLGHPLMYKKLIADGYQIVDHDNFYMHWHNDTELSLKLTKLEKFLNEIKVNKDLKNQMVIAAQHNYKNFWTKRKLQYIKNNYKILNECFGKNLVNQIYNNLNF